MNEHHEPTIEVVDDPAALAPAAAEHFVRAARAAVVERGVFHVALAGGSTPRRAYELLAHERALRERVPWAHCRLAIGDERHVPPDDERSNLRMARAALLDHVPVPPEAVCRFHAEEPDVDAVARRYERDLRALFAIGPDAVPRFDLVLLGLGEDAHTASLFPGTAALAERDRLAVANRRADGSERFTLTAPAINAAAEVLFLVAGAGKAEAVRAVLEGPHDPERYPAQLVAPIDGTVTWLVDRAAAGRLDRI